MTMKKIPEVALPDAETLTPLQMNAIPLDTGDHSHFVADDIKSDSKALFLKNHKGGQDEIPVHKDMDQ